MMPNIKEKKPKAVLKSEILERIQSDEALQGLIAKATGRTAYSVKRWIDPSKGMTHHLLTPAAQKVIREYLGLKPSTKLFA